MGTPGNASVKKPSPTAGECASEALAQDGTNVRLIHMGTFPSMAGVAADRAIDLAMR